MKRYREYTFLTWRDIALLLLMGATFIGACSVVAWMDKPVEVDEEPVFEAVELVEEIPVEEPEPTAWDDFIWFLEGLFA